MAMPEREQEHIERDVESTREVPTGDRIEQRTTRLEPVERERYVRATQVVSTGSMLSWGSVLAGTFVTFGLLFFLGLVGAAFGLTTVRASAPSTGQIMTASLIWAAVVMVVSFFIGGWIAGRATGHPSAGVSSFVVGSVLWAFAVTLAVLATAIGIGGAAASALGVFIPSASATPGNLTTAESAAIGTLIGLVLAWLAALAGAAAGTRAAPHEYE